MQKVICVGNSLPRVASSLVKEMGLQRARGGTRHPDGAQHMGYAAGHSLHQQSRGDTSTAAQWG